MVFSYGYCWWQNRQWRTNAPCLPAISMATTVRRSNTDGITQFGMSRATPEATGCWHRAATCSVLPQPPPGQQANKQQSTNTPTKLAILMAIAMRRYYTVRITLWRRSRASLEATGCHHWASTCSNSINRSCQHLFLYFSLSNCQKRPQSKRIAPNNTSGMTYQTDEKHLSSLVEFFVRGVSIALNCLNNCFLLRVINQ